MDSDKLAVLEKKLAEITAVLTLQTTRVDSLEKERDDMNVRRVAAERLAAEQTEIARAALNACAAAERAAAEQAQMVRATLNARISGGGVQGAQNAEPIAPTRINHRVPDLIKLAPEFKGDPTHLVTWIKSINQKIDLASSSLSEEEKIEVLPVWLGIIRDKITGKANDALIDWFTPVDWDIIKRDLTEYFGDKRDLPTLFSRVSSLRQGSKSVENFYNEARGLLSAINAKVTLSHENDREAKAVMSHYEQILTHSFTDGLNEPLSGYTRVSGPKTLKAAYQFAAEHDAAMRRKKERFGLQHNLPHSSRPSLPRSSWQERPGPSKPNSNKSKPTSNQTKFSSSNKFSKANFHVENDTEDESDTYSADATTENLPEEDEINFQVEEKHPVPI